MNTRLLRTARQLVLPVVVSGLLSACFPYAAPYVHVEADQATPVLEFCRISGPQVGLSYERQGARIEVSIEPGALRRSKAAYVALRVARGREVSVQGNATVQAADGTPLASVALQRTTEPLATRRPGSRPLPLPPGADQFEEIRFELRGMPAVGAPGVLLLPPITIDGVETSLPPIRFERRHYAGVAPVNC